MNTIPNNFNFGSMKLDKITEVIDNDTGEIEMIMHLSPLTEDKNHDIIDGKLEDIIEIPLLESGDK